MLEQINAITIAFQEEKNTGSRIRLKKHNIFVENLARLVEAIAISRINSNELFYDDKIESFKKYVEKIVKNKLDPV